LKKGGEKKIKKQATETRETSGRTMDKSLPFLSLSTKKKIQKKKKPPIGLCWQKKK